jgi:GntR family transcriptional regulator/MocR family aminotransferase
MPGAARLPVFIERNGRSLQEQIYSSIRRCIVDGRVPAGRRLPSTRELAADLRVSRTTALLAVEQLRAEGYVVALRGSGTFVATLPPGLRAARPESIAEPVARPPFSRRGVVLAGFAAPDRRRAGTPPCAFRLGTPALDLFPRRTWSQLARECLRTSRPVQLDYAPLAGLQALREAIAGLLHARGSRCDADQVIVVAGAQRGLDLIARLLLDPGDGAWIEDPGYPGARGALLAAGARVRARPVDAEGLVIDGAGAGEARLAYVTPSCQFPLGVPMSLARRRALLDWARRAQAWIIEDDYDCDLRHSRVPLPCLHSLDPDGRVIYVGTFSKSMFPALRLGFLVVPRDLQAGFIRARLAADLHPPVFEQRVLAAFIGRGHFERHLRRMQSAYSERLDALQRAIARVGAPLRLRPVHAGMHAIVEVEGMAAERVHAAALTLGVESMPLSAYYEPGPVRASRPPNALFLGFGAVSPTQIRTGVTRLARAIELARREQLSPRAAAR